MEPIWNWEFIRWALIPAGVVYGATSYGIKHLSDGYRQSVALWLNEQDENLWAVHFNRLFDRLMGARTFGLRRILASGIASLLSVFMLWLLFGPVLNLMGSRTDITMPLGRLMVVGLAINLVADYLSLIETRWLLGRFETVRSILLQVLLLLLDLAVSAAIILAAISLWRLGIGERMLSPVELLAGYTPYAIFFYSTFLTSIWAWAFCLSAWTIRAFARTGLGRLDVVWEKPFQQLGLFAGVVVFAGMVLGTAIAGRVMPADFDGWVCDTFRGYSCTHAARLSEDQAEIVERLKRACTTGDPAQCRRVLGGLENKQSSEAAPLLEAACRDGRDFAACVSRGYMYESGLGGAADPAKARRLYQQACGGEDTGGCFNLGLMFQFGDGVPPDLAKARELYQRACDGEHMNGCTNLGGLYLDGLGGPVDLAKARGLYQRACEGEEMSGCYGLGLMYQNGPAGPMDPARAREMYKRACEGKFWAGCVNLGMLYDAGLGGPIDLAKARGLYQQACDGGKMPGCFNLGVKTAKAEGGEADLVRALQLFEQACAGKYMPGCYVAGQFYENGVGTNKDTARAQGFYKKACEGGNTESCDRSEALEP